MVTRLKGPIVKPVATFRLY